MDMRSLRPTLASVVLLSLGVALAPIRGVVAQQGTQAPSGQGVRPGDRVEITMFTAAGEPLEEVGGTRTVDGNGVLFLPFVGSLEVQGLHTSEIRELLVERYADFFSSPVIDVQTRIRVNVTGSVRQPGNYFVDPTSTIIDVLSTAGGLLPAVNVGTLGASADASAVRLVRDGETRILDLRPEEANEAVLHLVARSGDWLHVPPRPRSEWRDNLQLLGSFFSVVGSVIGIVFLVSR